MRVPSGDQAGAKRKSSAAMEASVSWVGGPEPSAGTVQMSWWPERPL